MAFIEIAGLQKRFGSTDVLKNFNLTIEKGDFVVLLGPSGCGKSTLLNAIAGLEKVTGGHIWIDGALVDDDPPGRRDIAMVFQSYALYPTMTVEENLAFGLEMGGIPKTERQRAVSEIAHLLQIGSLLKRRPGQLSGGQRQRVAMGRALVRKPRLFLMDEPLSNLDAKLRVDIRTEIKRLHQSTGATILYVTHDQSEALTLATRIVVLSEGEIQQVGTPAEIYEGPANLFVARFIGSPSMNLLDARIVATAGGHGLAVASAAGELVVPVAADQLPAPLPAGRPVILGIRPEAILAGPAVDGNVAAASFHAVVDVVEPAGPDVFVVMRLGGQEVTARLPAKLGSTVQRGEERLFSFDADSVVLFDPVTSKRLSRMAFDLPSGSLRGCSTSPTRSSSQWCR